MQQQNDDGYIALKYRQPIQILVRKTPSGKDYVFVPQANISMAWVNPKDIDNIISRKIGCCGKKQQAYFFANENDVRQWTNKGGR